MEKNILIAVVVAVAVAVAVALLALSMQGPGQATVEPGSNATEPVGPNLDPHGCDIAAGESWCEAKQACLGPDEICVEAPFGEELGEMANELWGAKSVIYPSTNEQAEEGWLRSSFSVPDRAEFSHVCYIFMRGNMTRELDGTHFREHGPVTIDANEVCEIAVDGGMVEDCGGLIIHIDIDAMMEGYDPEADNWEDFMECLPGKDTAFCRQECDTLMETLMFQERRPMQGSLTKDAWEVLEGTTWEDKLDLKSTYTFFESQAGEKRCLEQGMFSGRPGFGQTLLYVEVENRTVTLSNGKEMFYGSGGLVLQKKLMEPLDSPWGDVECVDGQITEVCDPDHDTIEGACVTPDGAIPC